MDIQKGEGKGSQNADQDWVCQYAEDSRAYFDRCRTMPLDGQYDHGKYIIERNCSDDHQRSHACVMVHIFDKGKAEDGGAAPIGCLDEGALFGIIFHEEFCQAPDGKDDEKGYDEAEQHIAAVEIAFNIILCQIFEYQDWQSSSKDVFVCGFGKLVVNDG